MIRDGGYFEDYTYTIEATNHATGSVAMCAAISTLMQTIDAWVRMSKAQLLESQIDYGHCKVKFRGKGARTAFNVIYAGFLGLQEADKENLQVELRKK